MTAPLFALTAVAGGAGAVARVVVERLVADRRGRAHELGVLAVNLSGAFLLGLLAGAALSGDALRLAGTGLLGGYTTFSTWMLESQELGSSGRRGLAAANVAGSLAAGLLAVWLGRQAGGLS